MNSLARGFAALITLAWTSGGAWAASPETPSFKALPGSVQLAQNLPNSSNNDPYSNPIRRANPNSMQGTRSAGAWAQHRAHWPAAHSGEPRYWQWLSPWRSAATKPRSTCAKSPQYR